MAIITEQFITANNNLVRAFVIYDNKNTTNEARWRLAQIRIENDATTAYQIRVQDPADPSITFTFRAEAGQRITFDVPPPLQTKSVWDYNWYTQAA